MYCLKDRVLYKFFEYPEAQFLCQLLNFNKNIDKSCCIYSLYFVQKESFLNLI